jgi:hypothetical protein
MSLKTVTASHHSTLAGLRFDLDLPVPRRSTHYSTLLEKMVLGSTPQSNLKAME